MTSLRTNMRILVIERDKEICNTLKALLDDHSLVVCVTSTQEAKQVLSHNWFDYVIADHFTFRLTGEYQVLDTQNINKARVIVMTTLPHRAGIDFVGVRHKLLVKPFDLANLTDLLGIRLDLVYDKVQKLQENDVRE